MQYCDNCGRASVLKLANCLGCGMRDPGWQAQKVPWALSRRDAAMLRAIGIDPEVPLTPSQLYPPPT